MLALAFGAVALWTLVPGLQESQDGGLIGGGLFLLISLLRGLPVVRVLPVGQRWGLYALAALWLPISVTLALGLLRPDGRGTAMLDFFLPTGLILLVLLPVFAGVVGLWNRFGRGWARRLILPGPDERPVSDR